LYERGDFRRDEIYASSTEKILHVPGLANTGVSYYGSHVEPDIKTSRTSTWDRTAGTTARSRVTPPR
jgi:hypothetical protein